MLQNQANILARLLRGSQFSIPLKEMRASEALTMADPFPSAFGNLVLLRSR